MERDLSVERLYFLGNYKNIKFGNTLKGIPEELAKNPKVVSLLFADQALTCDIAYRKYHELTERIVDEKITDILSYLETERQKNFAELYEEIKKVQEDKETE